MEPVYSAIYATHLYVRHNEAADYEAMRSRLLDDLRPLGALEESLALRIINAEWRIHRCDRAEAAIPTLGPGPDSSAATFDFSHPAHAAINRARTAAENTIRRTTRDLKELQAERWRRATLKLTGPVDPQELGLAPIRVAMSDIPSDAQRNRLLDRRNAMYLQNEANAQPVEPKRTPLPIRTVPPAGRNAPCPCNSGQKFKRCCGHWSKAA